MGYIAKLRYGSHELNLNDGPYGLDPMFVPPTIVEEPQMTAGSMGRPFQGGKRIRRKLKDRAFNLPLQISGSQPAETHGAVRRLDSFIDAGLDHVEPLYFVYAPDDSIPYEPKYGQSWLYYEIKSRIGSGLGSDYGLGATRATRLVVNQGLMIGPVVDGKLQLAGSATGGILEHTYATQDRNSRGVQILETTTNEVANPIFGHSTYTTGYTINAGLAESDNTDEEFVLFGSHSLKASVVAGANRNFTTSVTCAASASWFSVYVKLPDGGAVSASQITMSYNAGGLTLTYTPIGDGWYWIFGTATGTGGAATFQVNVLQTAYIGGVQAEVNTMPTPLAHGDMLDCAWAGTAHNSDTTRTAARVRWSTTDVVDLYGESTLRVVWVPPIASTAYPAANHYIFEDDSGLLAWWNGATTEWSFTDGTNTATTSGKSFAAGTPVVLYFSFSAANGITIYVDGTQGANDSTYTPPTLSNYFYLGSGTAAGSQINGTFLDFTTWGRELSATEISNDYNNISQHVSGGDGYGQQLNAIPWFWTDDGDNTLDNCLDSSRENWGVIGGVPGNVDAATLINFDTSDVDVDIATIYFNQVVIDQNQFVSPSSWAFFDLSGTAVAGACGGQVERQSVGSAILAGYDATVTAEGARLINGKRIESVFFRVKDASSTTVNFKYSYLGDVSYANSYEAMATTTSFRLKRMDGFIIQSTREFTGGLLSDYASAAGTLQVDAIRDSGTANLDLDYLYMAVDRLMAIEEAADDMFFYYSSRKKSCVATGSQLGVPSANISAIAKVTGRLIEFTPGKLNVFINLMGGVDEEAVFDDTIQYNIYVTPRWALA